MFGGSRFSGSVAVKDHPNAQIYYNGSKIGTGTSVGLYPRNQPLTLTVKQEGCESKTITYNKSFRTGNFILSLVMWGLVGVAVDLGTGASYKPDHIHNPSIEKMSDKNFIFTVDYSECPSGSK
jgi:hypothetical protein